MNNDLISREALKKAFEETVCIEPMPYAFVKQIINNAPTVDERPQGELAEKLKDRIEESVCKYCPKMNRHCELCEISRVFSIIELTNEEMKGGAE